MISNFFSLYMIFRPRHPSIPLGNANSNASPRTSLRVMQSRSCRMQNVFSLLFVYQTGVGLTGWLVGWLVCLSFCRACGDCWQGAMVGLQLWLQYDQRQQIADSNNGKGAGYSWNLKRTRGKFTTRILKTKLQSERSEDRHTWWGILCDCVYGVATWLYGCMDVERVQLPQLRVPPPMKWSQVKMKTKFNKPWLTSYIIKTSKMHKFAEDEWSELQTAAL